MKKRFGDRRDATKVRDIHVMQNIMIDFKPNRCDSFVYMNAKIDVTNFVKFIKELKEDGKKITFFHGIIAVLAKTVYSRPKMNYFVANRTLYNHDDVSFGFVAKEEFEDDSVELLTILKVKEEDTLFDIADTLYKRVQEIRSKKSDADLDGTVDFLGKLPKIFRVPLIGFLKWMDKHGWLPRSLMNDNIYYSSAIVTNIGTFKVGAIHHNLTNFGTASSLISFGEIKEENKRYYMEMGAALDERIADGFYFCKALKLIEYLFDNPELLLKPAGEHVSIPTVKKEDKKDGRKK